MGSRKSLQKFQTVTNADMATPVTSAVTNIEFLDDIGIELDWTGSPSGTFAVQVSISYAQDQNGNVTNAGNWNAITLSPVPTASGTSGSYYIDIFGISSPWIRFVYTPTSGTGTLNAYICGKSI
jgi:hypothetical protein